MPIMPTQYRNRGLRFLRRACRFMYTPRLHDCYASLASAYPLHSTLVDAETAWRPALSLQCRRTRVQQQHNSHRSR